MITYKLLTLTFKASSLRQKWRGGIDQIARMLATMCEGNKLQEDKLQTTTRQGSTTYPASFQKMLRFCSTRLVRRKVRGENSAGDKASAEIEISLDL